MTRAGSDTLVRRPRRQRGRAGAWALLAAVLLASCTKGSAPSAAPNASALLSASSQAMSSVTSAHFTLQVAGDLSDLPVRSAAGVVTRAGQASATASIDLLGILVSYQVVVTGGTIYLKGPTGGYRSAPASTIYDVSKLLDPTRGVAGLLAAASNGQVLGTVTIDNTPAYTVQASVPTGILDGLTTLAPGQGTVPATLWIGRTGNRLLQVRIPFRTQQGKADTVVTATLSEFNLPTSIQAPSVS